MRIELKAHLKAALPQLEGKKLLLAVSGGIDSVVLTHLMHELKYSIGLAHCNFLLRGKESNKDEQFVLDLGERLGVKTYTKQFNTRQYADELRISTQMAARDLRYNWFKKLCRKKGFDYILTAHHQEDILETFLINLTRGTGLSGLTGIKLINGNIVRPLLIFSKNEILVHASKHKLSWREDESNSSIKYIRNKIRHKIVPVLKEINPNLLNSFDETIANLKGSEQIVKDSITRIRKKVVSVHDEELHFNIAKIKKLGNPKFYLYELLNAYGFTAWNDVVDLLEAQSGKQLFSNNFRLLKDRESLILTPIQPDSHRVTYEVAENTDQLSYPVPLQFEKMVLPKSSRAQKKRNADSLISDSSSIVNIDFDKIRFPLTIRKWEKGDVFYPLNMTGQKKLSKFFKDEKFSIVDKEKTWLLCSDDQIIWVIGHRLDDRFKVTENTDTMLNIAIDTRIR